MGAGLEGRDGEERRPARRRRRRHHRSSRARGKQPDYLYGIPVPEHRPQRPQGGGEGRLEPVPRLLERRQLVQRRARDHAAAEGHRPRHPRRRLLQLLRRPGREVPQAESAQPAEPVPRRRHLPDRPAGHARSPGATATPTSATRCGPSSRRCAAFARSAPPTAPTATSAPTSAATTASSSTASPRTSTWKLVGKRDALRVVDPNT